MLTFTEVDQVVLPPTLSENAYHALWLAHVANGSDWLACAFNGGVYADRVAWVFISGYQAAIRDTFVHQSFDDWSAFCVSEDRNGKLAPVTCVIEGTDTYVVTGSKTWVAASDHVQDLVIKAGRGRDAVYLRVQRNWPGVELVTGDAGTTLPELSQGCVHLHKAEIPATGRLDSARVADFGAREAVYILVALLGWICRAHRDLRAQIQPLLQLARQLAAAPIDRAGTQFQAFAAGVRALMDAAGHRIDNASWSRDQRLLQMYARPA